MTKVFDSTDAQLATDEARQALLDQFFTHYKGDRYLVHDVVMDEETGDVRVSYTSIDPGPRLGWKWSRRLSVWKERVTWPDGIMRPRFVAQSRACAPWER